MGKKKHRASPEVPKKENFIVRTSNEADDLKMLDPFINELGMEGSSRFAWVAKRMGELRRSATKQELTVARWLYSKRVRFVAQAPFRLATKKIGHHCYFADFYVPAINLIIEIDGSQHQTPEGLEYDRNRDDAFRRTGITTIRISNRKVSNGDFKKMIPIPDEEFLMPMRVVYIPEGVSGLTRAQKIALAKKFLGYENGRSVRKNI